MRFPGLYNNTTYRNLSGAQILASYLVVHDSTGNGPQYVKLHPVKSGTSWTESTVTYNNMPSYDSTIDCGNTLGTSEEEDIPTQTSAYTVHCKVRQPAAIEIPQRK